MLCVLGEDEDWLRDISIEMEIEDGVIWVYGVGEHGVKAFTDFGSENLIELIRFYKENPELLRRRPCGLRRMDTSREPESIFQRFIRVGFGGPTSGRSVYHSAGVSHPAEC